MTPRSQRLPVRIRSTKQFVDEKCGTGLEWVYDMTYFGLPHGSSPANRQKNRLCQVGFFVPSSRLIRKLSLAVPPLHGGSNIGLTALNRTRVPLNFAQYEKCAAGYLVIAITRPSQDAEAR